MPKFSITLERFVLQEAELVIDAPTKIEAAKQALHQGSTQDLEWVTLDDEGIGEVKDLKVQMSFCLDNIGTNDIPWE